MEIIKTEIFMAIVKKEKYLKDIAALVHKGVMDFEGDDRPSLEMGGRKVYVSSVGFSYDLGELTYKVSTREGTELASAHGLRPLSGLDQKTLSAVSDAVRRYAVLRRERERNLVNVESRLRAVAKNPAPAL